MGRGNVEFFIANVLALLEVFLPLWGNDFL